ncbi:MAG: hypothetical protein ACFFC3_14645 [Candidatus Odinarchaeota archaeon]
MSFESRSKIGNMWSKKVFEIIKNKGLHVVSMGAENIVPEVHTILSFMKNPDNTSKFVRYMPDGFAIDEKKETAFFYDAKNGKAIEKDAYLTYLTFAADNRRLYIFIQNDADKYCVPIDKLAFIDSYSEVSKYSLEMQLPIDDDGWIAPRLLPENKYLKWKYSHSDKSGTPYKYFDFDAMKKYLFNTS